MKFAIENDNINRNLTKFKDEIPKYAKVTHFAHKLKIANFTHFLNSNDWKHAQIITNDFVPKKLNRKFLSNIEVCPNEKDDDGLSVLVCFENFENCDFKVIYRLSLLDGIGNVHFSKVNCNFAKKFGIFSWENDVDLKYILNPENQVLVNNILTIFCEIVIVEDYKEIELNHVDLLDGFYYDQDQFHIVPVVRNYFNAKPKVIESLAHKWIIENVSNLFDDKTNWGVNQIHSDKFYSNDGIQFSMILCENSNENLGIYLRCCSEEQLNVRFKFTVSEIQVCKVGQNIFSKQNAWGFEDFVLSQTLFDNFSNGSMLDQKFQIICEIQILDENQSQIKSILPPQKVSESISNAKFKVVDSLAHKWTINNFDYLCKNNQNSEIKFEKIKSASFGEKLYFYLTFVPTDESRKRFAIFLHHFSVDKVKIRFKLSVLNQKGCKCFTQVGVETFCSKKKSFEFVDFVSNLPDCPDGLLNDDKLIIYCEIQIIEDSFDESKLENNRIVRESESFSNAKPEISDTIVHKWTLDNFRQFYNQNQQRIESSKFSFNNDLQFQLRLYPNGKNQKHKNSLSLFLYHFSKEKVNLNVRFELSIVNENGKKLNSKVRQRKFIGTKDYWGFVDFVSVSKLLDQSSGLLFEDKLSINCEVQILEDRNVKSHQINQNLSNQITESYFDAKLQLIEDTVKSSTISTITASTNSSTNDSTNTVSMTPTPTFTSTKSNSNQSDQQTETALQQIYNSYDSIKFGKCAHRWTIKILNMEEFSESNPFFESKFFSPLNSPDVKFGLQIIKFRKSYKDCVSVYLNVDKKRNTGLLFRYNYSIVDVDGKQTILKDKYCSMFIEKSISATYLNQNLTHDEFQSIFLQDGNQNMLTLQLKIFSIEHLYETKLSKSEIKEYLDELYKLDINDDEITYTVTNENKNVESTDEKSSALNTEKTDTKQTPSKIKELSELAQKLVPAKTSV